MSVTDAYAILEEMNPRFWSTSAPRPNGPMSARPISRSSARRRFLSSGSNFPRCRSRLISCTDLLKILRERGRRQSAPVLFLCRSGARSRAAAIALTAQAGRAASTSPRALKGRSTISASAARRRLEGPRPALGAVLTLAGLRPFDRLRNDCDAPLLASVKKGPECPCADVVEEPEAMLANRIEESWKRCGARLRAELGEDIFSSWFGRLELEGVVDRQARFTVPTRFLKSWIESHYLDRILAALNAKSAKSPA